jgi:hypothetical protein
MTSKYAALLALKYQSIEETTCPTERWLWTWIYPLIQRTVMQGNMEIKTGLDIPESVRARLRKDGYLLINEEHSTRIVWREHAG